MARGTARQPLPESVPGPSRPSVFSDLPASGVRGLAGEGAAVSWLSPPGDAVEGGPCVHAGCTGQPPLQRAAGPKETFICFLALSV